MSRRLRATIATGVVCFTALLAVACGSSQGNTTRAVSAVRPLPRVITSVGKSVTTANGNAVTVTTYTAAAGSAASSGPTEAAAAHISACSGAHETQVDPRVFRVLFANRQVIDADTASPQRLPSLHLTVLAPHRCTDGWVTFDVPKGSTPAYVVMTGSSLVGWRIP